MTWNYKGVKFDHPPRWCSHCLTMQPVKGGEYLKIDPHHQQWWCGRCLTLVNQKEDVK
jgi:hypothetical protein